MIVVYFILFKYPKNDTNLLSFDQIRYKITKSVIIPSLTTTMTKCDNERELIIFPILFEGKSINNSKGKLKINYKQSMKLK